MEKIGENLNGNSQIQNKNWISESSKKSSIFRRLYLQIYWESDKTLNNKVVDLHFLYMFGFGKISSAVQISSEKLTWKSLNLRLTLIPSDTQTLELNNSRTAKNLKKTVYRKFVALGTLYIFHIHRILTTVQFLGENHRWISLDRGALTRFVSSSELLRQMDEICNILDVNFSD